MVFHVFLLFFRFYIPFTHRSELSYIIVVSNLPAEGACRAAAGREAETMGERAAERAYRIIKGTIRLFYPRFTCEGVELIPEEPVIFVGNHSQMDGPIAGEFYMPVPRKTWCASQMMERKEVAAYAFQDFWAQNPKWTHWFYKGLARAIVPLSVLLFNHAETIPVYRDNRVLSTFRATIQALESGVSVLIFPEKDGEHDNILYPFQDHFIDAARLWYKRSGKALRFVPLYVCRARKTLCFGEPVVFDPTAPLDAERARVCEALRDRIRSTARALPRHRVVPYRPMKKRLYPYNRPKEADKA